MNRLFPRTAIIATTLVLGCGRGLVSQQRETPSAKANRNAPASETDPSIPPGQEPNGDEPTLEDASPLAPDDSRKRDIAGRADNQTASEFESEVEETAHGHERIELSDPNLSEELFAAQIGYSEALAPEHLSCQGAIPFRDAICSIAERVCSAAASPSIQGERDCQRARRACDAARQKYAEQCGG